MREQRATGTGVKSKIARALIAQPEAVAGEHCDQTNEKGCTPAALATGASAMVMSGAAACHRTNRPIAKQSRARSTTSTTGAADRSPAGGGLPGHPAIDPGALEDDGEADEHAEQQREVPIHRAQRVDRDHARGREHASRENCDPGRIDVVQRLGHKAQQQAAADAERDLLVARHRAEQRPLQGERRCPPAEALLIAAAGR